MPESIVYSLRLPPDLPSFDINRVTPRILAEATTTEDMETALMPICKLVGLTDYKVMTQQYASPKEWSGYKKFRPYWLLCWLLTEAKARKA